MCIILSFLIFIIIYKKQKLYIWTKLVEKDNRKEMKSKAKTQIIEAAGITFGRYGFKKTTMDDIAYAAGKGKSSLYYYFKNKEEVFEAVAVNEAKLMEDAIKIELAKQITAIDKLRHYISIHMKRFAAKGVLNTALNDNFLATFSFIEKIRNNYRDWEMRTISDILEDGIRTKEFKTLDISFTGEAILTCMIGFEVPLMTKDNSEEEIKRKINEVIDMFFYGICN